MLSLRRVSRTQTKDLHGTPAYSSAINRKFCISQSYFAVPIVAREHGADTATVGADVFIAGRAFEEGRDVRAVREIVAYLCG